MIKKLWTLTWIFLAIFQVSCAGEKPSNGTKVEIETEYGTMVFRLYDETPLHRDNFIKLAQEGFYDELLFHRVINQFMIQGGDPKSKNAQPGQRLGGGDPGYTIPAEIKPELFHKKGTLAAARTPDQMNPEKRSSGSQFYIIQGEVFSEAGLDSLEMMLNARQAQSIQQTVFREHEQELNKLMHSGQQDSLNIRLAELKELATQKVSESEQYKISPEKRQAYTTIGGYPSLDGGYTVFGEMLEGFEILDKIAAVQTDRFDRPTNDIKMKVKILK